MDKPQPTVSELWIEVSNVALYSAGPSIAVQLKNDFDTQQWLTYTADEKTIKAITDAFKEKRLIHAKIASDDAKQLVVNDLRVALTASRVP